MDMSPAAMFRDRIYDAATEDIMRRGNILPPTWDARALVDRLVVRLAAAEASLGGAARERGDVLEEFREYVDRGLCVLGTPLLTNVGAERGTLSSCASVPAHANGSFDGGSRELAERYYNLNMGSGYNLARSPDPVGTLLRLNEHARLIQAAGSCERYVGNMAHLPVTHPRIRDFIRAKVEHANVVHFNISVDLSETFMAAVRRGAPIRLDDGSRVLAGQVWDDLVECAWLCGDPGIISLDRYNAFNPVRASSPYVTTAPCAEVGLAEGETCTFGYVNLAACLREVADGLELDCELIGRVAACLTRVLDDAVESSLARFPAELSCSPMRANRKIGISICGYADALAWVGLDYGSDAGIEMLRGALASINFQSKAESARLARVRGPFPAFRNSRYLDPRFLGRFQHGSIQSAYPWRELAEKVERDGLRNATTTALPPSGRAALLLGVTPSLEPLLERNPQSLSPSLLACMAAKGASIAEARGGKNWSLHPHARPIGFDRTARLFRSAREISWQAHLAVTAAATTLIDEGVSKTVNLGADTSPSEVDEILRAAWSQGLKAISVYRKPFPRRAGVHADPANAARDRQSPSAFKLEIGHERT